MAFSSAVVSFIIVGLMFIVLLMVAQKIYVYASTLSHYLKDNTLSGKYDRTTIVIENASSINSSCFLFNLRNKGPSPILLDSSSNVIVDYYENNTLAHLVEELEFNKTWYTVYLIVGSKNYTIPRGYVLELKPGQTAVIEACVSRTISSQKSVVVIFTTRDGVKAEYVFTP